MSMPWDPSLEWDKPGGVGSTDTGPSVLDGLVADGKLSKVVPNHLRLDLNLVECLAIVDTNDASNHLRDNDHVAEMGPHWLWLLTGRSILFLFKGSRVSLRSNNVSGKKSKFYKYKIDQHRILQ